LEKFADRERRWNLDLAQRAGSEEARGEEKKGDCSTVLYPDQEKQPFSYKFREREFNEGRGKEGQFHSWNEESSKKGEGKESDKGENDHLSTFQ